MIAPLRDTTVSPSKRKLLRARMAVASALLPARKPATAPPLAAWKAWLWTAWIVLIAALFVARFVASLTASEL